MVDEDMPVGLVFQSYHLMVAMIRAHHADEHSRARVHLQGRPHREDALVAVGGGAFAHLAVHRHSDGLDHRRGGAAAWVVYPSVTGPDGVSLLTADGISMSVSAPELWLTLGLFVLVYLVLLIGWARVIGRFIKEGPVAEGAAAADAAAVAVVAADAEGDVVVAEAVAAAGDSEKEGE